MPARHGHWELDEIGSRTEGPGVTEGVPLGPEPGPLVTEATPFSFG
jgi:hypothetical protein